ncbi:MULTISPECIES: hypothetical protein [Ralstonia]|uniref:hypothetical protein n=1 Tax=Ralstonia TaxID=48736 RepID=UPI002931BF18|nr:MULTISPECIES: hypothetical protein [Ralstonia]
MTLHTHPLLFPERWLVSLIACNTRRPPNLEHVVAVLLLPGLVVPLHDEIETLLGSKEPQMEFRFFLRIEET